MSERIERIQLRILGTPEEFAATVAESGYPGFEVAAWYGIWAPAKTPPAIIKKMNAEFNAILKMPDVRERFENAGAKILGSSAEDFLVFNKK